MGIRTSIDISGNYVVHHKLCAFSCMYFVPVLSTCLLHTNSGCGNERRILIGPW